MFVRFGSRLYGQVVDVPMAAGCAPLVAGLFFCGGRFFVLSLSGSSWADIVGAFGSTSGCLDDLLNIDNPFFEQMVGQMCPAGLQLNKADSSDAEAPILDLSMANGIVSSGIYDRRGGFGFGVVNFPFLGGGVPRFLFLWCVCFSVCSFC